MTIGRGKSYLIENSDDGISSTLTQDEVRAAASKEIAFYFSFAKDKYSNLVSETNETGSWDKDIENKFHDLLKDFKSTQTW